MQVLTVSSVDEAYYQGMGLLKETGGEVDTRNGKAISCETPVTTRYLNPRKRVITWKSREANAYFHLYESLWMLAGCVNVEMLSYFNKRMITFSDDGKTLPASYGWRWRHFFDVDQIRVTIEKIKANPNDRRLVIGMFDPSKDVENLTTKDIPCNLCIKFRVIHGGLDMIVFNRSNDIIWGAYGANAVHMSFLQEYVAHACNLSVGEYWQISSDFHAYQPLFDEKYSGLCEEIKEGPIYSDTRDTSIPIFDRGDEEEYVKFNYDLKTLEYFKPEFLYLQGSDPDVPKFRSRFFKLLVAPMLQSYHHIKMNEFEKSKIELDRIKDIAPDWHEGCSIWLTARQKSYEQKGTK